MTPEQIAELMQRHPHTILVPVSVEMVSEAIGEWIECDRIRLEPKPDGLHDLIIFRRDQRP